MDNSQKCIISLVTISIYVLVYCISPYLPYAIDDYPFIYILAHRKFWYVWIISILLLAISKHKIALIFTTLTTIIMFIAQYLGDIDYNRQLLLREQGTDVYIVARHFGYWILLTIYSIVFLIFLWIFKRWVYPKLSNKRK